MCPSQHCAQPKFAINQCRKPNQNGHEHECLAQYIHIYPSTSTTSEETRVFCTGWCFLLPSNQIHFLSKVTLKLRLPQNNYPTGGQSTILSCPISHSGPEPWSGLQQAMAISHTLKMQVFLTISILLWRIEENTPGGIFKNTWQWKERIREQLTSDSSCVVSNCQ